MSEIATLCLLICSFLSYKLNSKLILLVCNITLCVYFSFVRCVSSAVKSPRVGRSSESRAAILSLVFRLIVNLPLLVIIFLDVYEARTPSCSLPCLLLYIPRWCLNARSGKSNQKNWLDKLKRK